MYPWSNPPIPLLLTNEDANTDVIRTWRERERHRERESKRERERERNSERERERERNSERERERER